MLSENLWRYRPIPGTRPVSSAEGDILDDYLAGRMGVSVYSEKTQGRPYHRAVLAVASLAEVTFPARALVSGCISATQCQEAVRDIEERRGRFEHRDLCYRLRDVIVDKGLSVPSREGTER